jgi:hypothetical protein
MRTTHTYATLEVSESTCDEIKSKLEAAGYHHLFIKNDEAPALPLISMQGIALKHEIEMIGTEKSPQY